MDSVHRPWFRGMSSFGLSGDEVHVWRAELERPATEVERLWETLSADEQARAAAFRFERDRRRFIVGRGVLRQILSRYLGSTRKDVQLEYSSKGKPHLAASLEEAAAGFNLAHSHELALYAVARGRRVGVDLEHIRPLPDLELVVAEVLSASEFTIWRELPAIQRQLAFYLCWTRKEAYAKATGDGIYDPLKQIEVTLAPGDPARLLRVAGSRQEADRWSVMTLTPAHGYVAALVVEGHDWSLICCQQD